MLINFARKSMSAKAVRTATVLAVAINADLVISNAADNPSSISGTANAAARDNAGQTGLASSCAERTNCWKSLILATADHNHINASVTLSVLSITERSESLIARPS